MKAIVLCAGLGTRLRPLTERWPKCAIPLLGRPLFRYNLAMLKHSGVTEVGVNTHYLPEAMSQVARFECERLGMPLTLVHEPVLQGSGGGVRGFRHFVGDSPFIVLNGDVLFAVELAPLYRAHVEEGRTATLVLIPMPPGEKYSAVETDANGKVCRIGGREYAKPHSRALRPWHFASVQILSPRIFDFMSPEGPEEMFTQVYARMLGQGVEAQGTVVEGAYWADLGAPRHYLTTVRNLLRGEVPLSFFPDVLPDGLGKRSVFIEEGSQVEAGSQLGDEVYVDKGARIVSGARVERTAVLEGTTVAGDESLADTIAWGAHRIRAA